MSAETWTPVEPRSDEPAPRDYWPTFKVGDRVRLVPNGECRLRNSVSDALRGELGTVVEVGQGEDLNGHVYHVRIDRPELLAWRWAFGPWCAATELELINEHD